MEEIFNNNKLSEVKKISKELASLGAAAVLFNGADLSKPEEIDNLVIAFRQSHRARRAKLIRGEDR